MYLKDVEIIKEDEISDRFYILLDGEAGFYKNV